MKVQIDKSFAKDVNSINDKKIKSILAILIEKMKVAKSLSEFEHLKKLKGNRTAYRIRIGNYRVGFFYEKGTIKLIRILHRNKIYNKFP